MLQWKLKRSSSITFCYGSIVMDVVVHTISEMEDAKQQRLTPSLHYQLLG
eukprot:m.35786 g.35786  ORF g.35786 m.35786 type:complete len:50 (-) comp6624_c0_seq2:2330-2479(-)